MQNPAKKRKYFYQPSVGVKADFENLLQRFSAAGTVRYQKFAEVWKEMKMSLYCAGRQTQREAREFVEECFHIAVQYWLPPSSFLVRAGALYLLYGLYYFQLVTPRVKIRVTNEDWRTVLEFHKEAREQQHLDLDYIFQKLLVGKAFHFVATPTELYPTFKDKEEHQLIIPDNLKEESNVVEEIFSESSLGQLEMVHEQYHKMKIALNGEDGEKPDSSLDIIHNDLIQGIQKTVQTHRWRQKTSRHVTELSSDLLEGLEDMDKQDVKDTSTKKSLKKKAYKTSMGYFKSWRKGQGKASDDTGDSTDNELLASEKKIDRRGRQHAVDLYEQDEMDLDPVGTDLHEVYGMPDLDKLILPNPVGKAEETGGTTEGATSTGKGKGPLKGTARPKQGKAASKKSSEGKHIADVAKKKAEGDGGKQKAGKGPRKRSVKSESKSEICSPQKRVKTEVPVDKTDTANGSVKLKTGKGGKKVPQRSKSGLKTSIDVDKKEAENLPSQNETDQKKKPSAQEILFQSLKQRRKQQMMKKKKKK